MKNLSIETLIIKKINSLFQSLYYNNSHQQRAELCINNIRKELTHKV